MVFSNGFAGIKNDPKWERGEISRLFITQILPGKVRLNLFQNSIFFLMLARIFSKLEFHLAGSAEMFIPRILVSSQREKPRSRTWSGTGIMLPICIIEVFSMLHFNPENVAKFCKMFFKEFKLSKLNNVATLVSSAKPFSFVRFTFRFCFKTRIIFGPNSLKNSWVWHVKSAKNFPRYL
jgi:hypothetical protein